MAVRCHLSILLTIENPQFSINPSTKLNLQLTKHHVNLHTTTYLSLNLYVINSVDSDLLNKGGITIL